MYERALFIEVVEKRERETKLTLSGEQMFRHLCTDHAIRLGSLGETVRFTLVEFT